MRSVPMNPESAIQWRSQEQAQQTGAVVGGVAGAAMGASLWAVTAKMHPSLKYLGAALPVLGGVFGYRSWKAMLEGSTASMAAR
jgi:hypothetical protein